MAADALEKQTLHETTLVAWDIPTAAAGERFTVKIGAKSSAGCAMGGCRIEVRDGAGAAAAPGRLGETPWPGTDALFWTEVELCAPAAPGAVAFSVSFDAAELEKPHRGATLAFNVPVVARPEHTLTVKVAADGRPLEEAIVRLGPYRSMTDAAGVATVKTASGSYELVVWKAGYDAPTVPVTIKGDAVVAIDARTLPEDDPDSHWTA